MRRKTEIIKTSIRHKNYIKHLVDLSDIHKIVLRLEADHKNSLKRSFYQFKSLEEKNMFSLVPKRQ